MGSTIHSQARTTPATRKEMRESGLSDRELAKKYNVTRSTARKWKNRDDQQDRSHRPHKLHTTLTPEQEAIVCILRTTLLLPLDDLLAVTREFINDSVSRSGMQRMFRREGLPSLKQLQAQQKAQDRSEQSSKKGFKDYKSGYFHIDIKYLPKMPDQPSRTYLYVAIDRATRWVFLKVYPDQSEQSSADFLRRLEQASAVKIQKILTDNGSQFTDRFTSKNKKPSGSHCFDKLCEELNIEHRLTPPRTPQMNGMVERFNGRVAEVIAQTRFNSQTELEQTLVHYCSAYNHHIVQRNIGGISPVQAMKKWQKSNPELFKKRVYKQTGLDT
jgi:transposase InsO family protein